MSARIAETAQASVLVVDDEVRQLAALCDTLEDAGYKTTGFTSARDALAALRETEFDLLLTDLTMPAMDGVTLLRAAQEIDPHLVGVVATAHGTIDTAVRAMQAGALDYILKPFTLSTALPVIERAIKVKRLRSENIQLREALALSEVSTTVASVLDPPVVLNKVADAVFNSLGANGTALFTANHDHQTLFSYSVSHDLRAPLRVINGFGRLLRDQHGTRLGEEARDYLARIEMSSHRMGEIIEGLFRLSQASRLKPRHEALDLAELARGIVADLQTVQPERSVQIVIQAPLHCCGDRQLLQTALENLLGNAWKFTARRADARIEVGMTLQDDRRIFFVRDNGAGFDPSGAARLFDAFQRLHSAQEFPGTGIGLATVHRIIRNHGGDIWAEGQSGKGATF